MENITKNLYESPMKERNENKYGYGGCICCCKPINNQNDCYYVHMNTNWVAVSPTIVTEENCLELTGAESQGCFPIGNECAKKMIGFIFKY